MVRTQFQTRLLVILSWLLCSHSLFAADPVIEIFTNAQHPITADDRATVYDLDQDNTLDKELTQLFRQHDSPGQREKAIKAVKQRISKYSEAEIRNIFAPRILAQQYGINRLPAMVFNQGESVIYGVTDLNAAIQQWENYHDQ